MTTTRTKPDRRQRSAARLACVQALYEMDVADAPSDPVLEAFISKRWSVLDDGSEMPEADATFLSELVRGVNAARDRLDAVIAPILPSGRDVAQLEVLLRAILRAGAYELSDRPDVPTKVAINEYVDVAHAFYAGKEPAMVNAVLDRLARHFRGKDTNSDSPKSGQ
ncbi:MAG: transcription antitermination factor NusB [Rhodospirillales bacterium]|nr:transcription antitermination factor NusB [Rhodospirillales bacterium]